MVILVLPLEGTTGPLLAFSKLDTILKGKSLNPTIKIRKAVHNDISGVVKVIRACTAAMRLERIFQWDDIYPNKEQVEEDLEEGSLYVIRNEDICLGAVSFNEKQEDAYQRVDWLGSNPVLVVHRLCVDPAFQGQGIAKDLMSFGERLALKRGYASIRLDAYSGNPKTVGLYERLGYQKVGSVNFPRRDLPFYCFEKILKERSEA
jgi:ribosomal protein S18 acetylase RimI-like enzyme